MIIGRAWLLWLTLGVFCAACDDGAGEDLDQGVAVDAGASDGMAPNAEAGTPTAQDGGLTSDSGGGATADQGIADAAPSGPDCLEVQDCDAVCEWFVECSVTECAGYDRTSSQPLDDLCRGACEVLADVLCNHRQCAETIDYISGLDPNGDYATACAAADRDPASP